MTFPLLYRNLPPNQTAPLWLKWGRKEGQRIQEVEPWLSRQPGVFPAHIKPRLSPKDLRPPAEGGSAHAHLWHTEAGLCVKAGSDRGPTAWHLGLAGRNQGSVVRRRSGGRPTAIISSWEFLEKDDLSCSLSLYFLIRSLTPFFLIHGRARGLQL